MRRYHSIYGCRLQKQTENPRICIHRVLRIVYESTVCTLYLTGAQASGANIDVAGRTLHDCFDTLDIGLPSTVGTTVRVRDLNTKRNALAADFAFCHCSHLLYRLVSNIYFSRYFGKLQAFFPNFRKMVRMHRISPKSKRKVCTPDCRSVSIIPYK